MAGVNKTPQTVTRIAFESRLERAARTESRRVERAAKGLPNGSYRLCTSAMMLPSLSLNHAAFAPPAITAPAGLRSPGMS